MNNGNVLHYFSESCHLLTLSQDNQLATVADHSCNIFIYDIEKKQVRSRGNIFGFCYQFLAHLSY